MSIRLGVLYISIPSLEVQEQEAVYLVKAVMSGLKGRLLPSSFDPPALIKQPTAQQLATFHSLHSFFNPSALCA